MATEIGTISLTGLLTCKLCDWSEYLQATGASEKGQLTLHWIDAHFDEFDRIAPKAAAAVRVDAATELTRHDQEHGHNEEGTDG